MLEPESGNNLRGKWPVDISGANPAFRTEEMRSKSGEYGPIFIKGTVVEWVKVFKFLGVREPVLEPPCQCNHKEGSPATILCEVFEKIRYVTEDLRKLLQESILAGYITVCRRKPEHPEETQIYTGRTYKLLTDRAGFEPRSRSQALSQGCANHYTSCATLRPGLLYLGESSLRDSASLAYRQHAPIPTTFWVNFLVLRLAGTERSCIKSTEMLEELDSFAVSRGGVLPTFRA
ncbi:uncharacterized protein [Narcine bancroftii]|uniref:uncharacterized protein n=1 Tax=Narcine bancroftii TaxID=1343680 RepID=UPI00383166EB